MINIAFSLIISFYFIFRHSRIFVSKTFVLPVIIFTILYNVPKFFELYVKEEVMTKTLNCSEVLSEDLYHGNMGCQVFKRGIQWYFVTKIVLTFCEKKMFSWLRKICKVFEITGTICSNSERSEHFLVTKCFFDLFLEVSHV